MQYVATAFRSTPAGFATLASITAELRLFSQWATTAELRNAALARAYDADRLTQALRGRLRYRSQSQSVLSTGCWTLIYPDRQTCCG